VSWALAILEDYKQLTLETAFKAVSQQLAERRGKLNWKTLSASSDVDHKSSKLFGSAWRTECDYLSLRIQSKNKIVCERKNSVCRIHRDQNDKLQAMLILKKRKNLKIDLDQITGFILAFFTGFTLAFFTGNTSSLTDLGQEYNWCPAGNTMGSNWCRMTCITKSVSSWQASRTSVQLGEPSHGVNYGTWTMTNTICATIKGLMFIMRSSDQT